MVLEKTLESPLNCKEIQLVCPKGDRSWVFIGRTDVEAETPIIWPPNAKSWLIWKDPDAGKDWGQEEKGTTEDEMVGWHHQLNGHGFGWTPGVGDGPGVLQVMGSQRVRYDWVTHFSLLSQWCYLTISSSFTPCSFGLQSFPAWRSFLMSQFLGQSIGVSALASVLPMKIQDWFPSGLAGWISLLSKGLSRVFPNTTVQKH